MYRVTKEVSNFRRVEIENVYLLVAKKKYPGELDIHQIAEIAQRNWQQLQTVVPDPNSYLIAAYPKSGTHWLWDVMAMILTEKVEIPLAVKEDYFLEFTPVDDLPTSSVYPYNTHFPPSQIPKNFASLKTIIIVRNPKDVMVSAYHHILAAKESAEPLPWDRFFRLFMDKMKENPSNISDNMWNTAKEAWSMQHKPNILVIFYEDMIKDFHGQVTRICRFMNRDVSDDFITRVHAANQIDVVRKQKIANAEKGHGHRLAANLYRKGKVGNWKDYFTVAQSEECDRLTSSLLKDCEGLQFTYEI